MRYLTVALAKGRLANKAMELFGRIGISCEEMKDKGSRKLIFVNEELGIRFFLAKASDVPTYVEYGAASSTRSWTWESENAACACAGRSRPGSA